MQVSHQEGPFPFFIEPGELPKGLLKLFQVGLAQQRLSSFQITIQCLGLAFNFVSSSVFCLSHILELFWYEKPSIFGLTENTSN